MPEISLNDTISTCMVPICNADWKTDQQNSIAPSAVKTEHRGPSAIGKQFPAEREEDNNTIMDHPNHAEHAPPRYDELVVKKSYGKGKRNLNGSRQPRRERDSALTFHLNGLVLLYVCFTSELTGTGAWRGTLELGGGRVHCHETTRLEFLH